MVWNLLALIVVSHMTLLAVTLNQINMLLRTLTCIEVIQLIAI